jgi:hypothetical protein
MKPVIIVWRDAGDHEDTWADMKNVDEWADRELLITSIGFLVKKTEKYYTLAGDFDRDNQNYGRVTKIPVSMAIELKELS